MRPVSLEHAQLLVLLQDVSDAVVVADADGRLVLLNAAAERLLGVGAADVPLAELPVRCGLCRSKDGTPFPSEELPLWSAVRGELGAPVELFLRNAGVPDGVLLRASGRPLESADGQVYGMMLLRDTRPAAAPRRLDSELVAPIVHDLKNPLASITANLEYLVEAVGAGSTDVGEALSDSKDAARRMLRTLQNLLDVSRLEEGRLELRRSPVDLRALAERMGEERRGQLRARTIHLAVRIEPGLALSADADLLARALENLLDSLLRRTPSGGSIEIAAERRPDRHGVSLRFGSSAPALPPDERDRLFRGRGLGSAPLSLYHCRLVAEAHGGSARIEEAPGLPARFVLDLP